MLPISGWRMARATGNQPLTGKYEKPRFCCVKNPNLTYLYGQHCFPSVALTDFAKLFLGRKVYFPKIVSKV
jgi:hypothetical protein